MHVITQILKKERNILMGDKRVNRLQSTNYGNSEALACDTDNVYTL